MELRIHNRDMYALPNAIHGLSNGILPIASSGLQRHGRCEV